MEKIIRKRVFYIGVGPEDGKMKQAAKRFGGRYYRALQSSHGWSFPVSSLSEIRDAIRAEAETAVSDGGSQASLETVVSESATQTERDEPPRVSSSDRATQTDKEETAVSDGTTQTDDKPVYRCDIDPALSRWIRDRYFRK